MQRIVISLVGGLASLAAWAAAAPDLAAASKPLTAAEIVQRNVAARGGLEAWRKVETMIWIGHIASQDGPVSTVPFMLELKRPNKTHFEIRTQNQVAMRIYDGTKGWKLRPSTTSGPDVQPYSIDELEFAHDNFVIDGPLVDYQAKGVSIALEGVEKLGERKAYRLKVTLHSGASRHVWIDAETFLDVKFDHPTSDASGRPGTMTVYYRSYQTIDGLQIPVIIETGSGSGKQPDRMTIDRLSLNPPLEDRVFAMPKVPGRRHIVTIAPPGEDGVSPMTRPSR
jgi:hypothetical protein